MKIKSTHIVMSFKGLTKVFELENGDYIQEYNYGTFHSLCPITKKLFIEMEEGYKDCVIN